MKEFKSHPLNSVPNKMNELSGFGLANRPSVRSSGGIVLSLEMYACQKETQQLVISQIANWIRAESYCLQDHGTSSIIFGSLDGTRVVHSVGWNPGNKMLDKIFYDFCKRADGPHGTPAALKESTHLYRTHSSVPEGVSTFFLSSDISDYSSVFSIDFFNCKRTSSFPEVKELLSRSASAADWSGMRALHILGSTDELVGVLLGEWRSESDYEDWNKNIDYLNVRYLVQPLVVEGTMSDILDKTKPSRAYRVVDIFIPE
eukprot:gene9152-12345_t